MGEELCLNVSTKPLTTPMYFPIKKERKEKNQITLQAECSWNAVDKVRFGVSSCQERCLGDRTWI